MSEDQNPETPPEGGAAPPQVEPLAAPDVPEGETFEPNTPPVEEENPDKTDEDQGVGTAPTEAGDAGEGNPGTQFQTTEQIEGEDGQGLADKGGQ